MNILLVAPEYPPYGSGIANVVHVLRGHMSRNGVNADILSQRGADINITNTFNALPGLAGLVPFWQKAADYAAEIADDYDAVWFHSPLLMNTKKLRYIKNVMLSFHTTWYGFYSAYKTRDIIHLLPYYYLADKLEHHFLRQLSQYNNVVVTAVSPSVAKELRRNGLTLFSRVIPNGLEMPRDMTLDKRHARAILQQEYPLKLPEKDCLLLYVGRITEVKQPFLTLKFFKLLNSINRNISLVMIGKGNLLMKLKKKVKSQQNIHVLGYVPHKKLPTFMNAADAFISLSCYEGLPLTVLEAITYGLPLILSNIPSHEWLMNSKIGRGILINEKNLDPKETLNFLYKTGGSKHHHDTCVKNQFTWEMISKQYLELVKN